MERDAARAAIREFLVALGHDPAKNPELAETPARVVEAFADELLTGYGRDLRALVTKDSSPAPREAGLIALRDVAVATVCPHHLMPAVGRANVIYRPGDRILGIGVIARLVDACARRLVLQEMIGEDVVSALVNLAVFGASNAVMPSLVPALALAYVTAAVSNYWLCRRLPFPPQAGMPAGPARARYAAVVLGGLLLDGLLTTSLIARGWQPLAAKLLAQRGDGRKQE